MLNFKIVSPSGVTYEDNQVTQVSVPTSTGEITILPNHIPLISVIAPGEMRIQKQGGHEVVIAVSTGLIEVMPQNEIRILADTAERAEHIDLDRAEAARKRAEELLLQIKSTEDLQFAMLQAKIEKELARVRVGRKYRKLPPVV